MQPRHGHPAAASAALAAATAALVLLTGCAAGTGASTGAQGARSAPSAQPGGGGGPAAGSGKASAASRAPMLPDARLTPATGSFTEKEKEYLSGRVPEDTDPAAVLQLGEEACQRVSRTARHDRDAAVSALVAGDVPGADDAVTHLCPQQKPLLRAAEAGLPDGTTDKPAAGTYHAPGAEASCAWRAVGSGHRVLASGAAAQAGKRTVAEIPAGTRQFVSQGCHAWLAG